MKCDELKAIKQGSVELGEYWVYDAEDVDAAIAELKDEINRKEGVEKRWFARCMEARTENVRLKRALWIARADRAIMTLDYFALKCRWFQDYMKVAPPKCDVKMVHKLANIERKCRAKAEEYK